MGAGIWPYCIDLEELRALYGSRDMTVLERIESLDYLDDNWDEPDEDGAPTTRTATTAILNGGLSAKPSPHAHCYRNALEWICRLLNDEPPNWDQFEKFTDSKSVDRVLAKMGLRPECCLTTMWDRGAPVPIPVPDDTTDEGIGYLTQEEVREAWSVLKTPNLLGVDGQNARRVMIYRSWLEKADSVNRGLVGFFG